MERANTILKVQAKTRHPEREHLSVAKLGWHGPLLIELTRVVRIVFKHVSLDDLARKHGRTTQYPGEDMILYGTTQCLGDGKQATWTTQHLGDKWHETRTIQRLDGDWHEHVPVPKRTHTRHHSWSMTMKTNKLSIHGRT